MIDYRAELLSFIASLTLCDHMGDVCDDINRVLKDIGEHIEWDDLEDLGTKLGRRGIKTLYGTDLNGE